MCFYQNVFCDTAGCVNEAELVAWFFNSRGGEPYKIE